MPAVNARDLKRRAQAVRLALMDVDGVLTNGLLFHFVDGDGQLVELKGVHTQDSIALSWLAEAGITTGCISGRLSQGMAERLKMLKASYIYQGRLDKKTVLDEICQKAAVKAENVLYIGDDFPDVPVLQSVGLAVAVANARAEVKARAHWVTRASGGAGAVREVTELVLKSQGLWEPVLRKYGL